MVALLNMKETQLDIGQQGERRKMLYSWMEKECEGGRITAESSTSGLQIADKSTAWILYEPD